MKLQCDEPLSNIAFNFNLRRYTKRVVYSLTATVSEFHHHVCGEVAATLLGATLTLRGRAVPVDSIRCSEPTGARAKAWCLLIHAKASLRDSLSLSEVQMNPCIRVESDYKTMVSALETKT